MNIKRCRKEAFTVIGKQGTTRDGEDFVNVLWKKANEGMDQIASLVKRDRMGAPVGFWGIRSSLTVPLNEWENGEGLYLAGLEVEDGSFAPLGWTKWELPASSYVSVEVEDSIEKAVSAVKDYAEKNELIIKGAYYEYMNVFLPGKLLLFFPVKEKSIHLFPVDSDKE